MMFLTSETHVCIKGMPYYAGSYYFRMVFEIRSAYVCCLSRVRKGLFDKQLRIPLGHVLGNNKVKQGSQNSMKQGVYKQS